MVKRLFIVWHSYSGFKTSRCISDLLTIHAHELNRMLLISREDKNVKIQLKGFNESETFIHPSKFLDLLCYKNQCKYSCLLLNSRDIPTFLALRLLTVMLAIVKWIGQRYFCNECLTLRLPKT